MTVLLTRVHAGWIANSCGAVDEHLFKKKKKSTFGQEQFLWRESNLNKLCCTLSCCGKKSFGSTNVNIFMTKRLWCVGYWSPEEPSTWTTVVRNLSSWYGHLQPRRIHLSTKYKNCTKLYLIAFIYPLNRRSHCGRLSGFGLEVAQQCSKLRMIFGSDLAKMRTST